MHLEDLVNSSLVWDLNGHQKHFGIVLNQQGNFGLSHSRSEWFSADRTWGEAKKIFID